MGRGRLPGPEYVPGGGPPRRARGPSNISEEEPLPPQRGRIDPGEAALPAEGAFRDMPRPGNADRKH